MKSTVVDTGAKPKEKEYPVLKTNPFSGTVVLFTDQNIGTVVSDPRKEYGIGHFRKDWIITCFENLKKVNK